MCRSAGQLRRPAACSLVRLRAALKQKHTLFAALESNIYTGGLLLLRAGARMQMTSQDEAFADRGANLFIICSAQLVHLQSG